MSGFWDMIDSIKKDLEEKEAPAENTIGSLNEDLNEAYETQVFEIDTDKLKAKKYFRLPGSKFAVIVGKTGWILVNDEAIHWIAKLGEPVKIHVYAPDKEVEPSEEDKKRGITGAKRISVFPEPDPANLYLEDLEQYEVAPTGISSPSAIDWRKWIHYFGIKDRMAYNYNLLQSSLKKIGAEIELPYFWEKHETK